MSPVAVVTGAASGLGLALAERCAALGMAVALLDLDEPRVSTEAARLAGVHGVATAGIHCDVADGASVTAAAAAVEGTLGGADLVVSNVGVQLFGALEVMTDAEWAWMLDVNVTGSARVARTFLPSLRRSGHGRLAFTTSSSVFDPASRLAAYQTTKFAVWGLAESLRVELRDDGIDVSVIFPSGMFTRHLETSEAAQPADLRRPIANDGDLDAMIASNEAMASMLATPEDASAGVIEAILDGAPYVVTHGDLTAAVTERARHLHAAADRARHR